MAKKNAPVYGKPGPLTAARIAEGQIWVDEDGWSVVGIAEDGVVVCLGSIATQTQAENLERYLRENPTPDMW